VNSALTPYCSEETSRESLFPLIVLLAGLFLQITKLFGFTFLGYATLSLHFVCVGGGLLVAGINARPLIRDALGASSRFERVVFFLLFCLPVASLMLAFLPVTARDALIYHLYVPHQWIHTGEMVPLPWHTWSYFPLMGSVAFAGLISWLPDSSIQVYHEVFFILTCILGLLTLREVPLRSTSKLSTILVVACTPLCMRIASEGMVDWITAFYAGGSFYYLVRLLSTPKERHRKLILLSGISLGLALSSKYTALLAALLLSLHMGGTLIYLYGVAHRAFTRWALFCIAAALTYSPWWMQNLILTGDPLYPFLFGEHKASASNAFIGSVSPLEYRRGVYGESWLDILIIPIRMILGGADGHTKTFDGVLTPFYLVLFLLPFLLKISRDWLLWSTSLLVILHVFGAPLMHHFVTRYHAPLLVPIVLLLAYAVDTSSSYRLGPAIRGAFLITHCGLSTLYLARMWGKSDVINYFILNRGESRDNYIRRFVSEKQISDLVSEVTPSDARVYLFYTGNRYHLYSREVRGTYFSADPLLSAFASSPNDSHASLDSLSRFFASEGITHLAVHTRFLNDALNPRERILWEQFLRERAHVEGTLGVIEVWSLRKA
jgi:hypothetical protein